MEGGDYGLEKGSCYEIQLVLFYSIKMSFFKTQFSIKTLQGTFLCDDAAEFVNHNHLSNSRSKPCYNIR